MKQEYTDSQPQESEQTPNIRLRTFKAQPSQGKSGQSRETLRACGIYFRKNSNAMKGKMTQKSLNESVDKQISKVIEQ